MCRYRDLNIMHNNTDLNDMDNLKAVRLLPYLKQGGRLNMKGVGGWGVTLCSAEPK